MTMVVSNQESRYIREQIYIPSRSRMALRFQFQMACELRRSTSSQLHPDDKTTNAHRERETRGQRSMVARRRDARCKTMRQAKRAASTSTLMIAVSTHRRSSLLFFHGPSPPRRLGSARASRVFGCVALSPRTTRRSWNWLELPPALHSRSATKDRGEQRARAAAAGAAGEQGSEQGKEVASFPKGHRCERACGPALFHHHPLLLILSYHSLPFTLHHARFLVAYIRAGRAPHHLPHRLVQVSHATLLTPLVSAPVISAHDVESSRPHDVGVIE